MAWQSGGTNNEEMVDNMKRFGVIHSDAVEHAFRAVDRRFFVPSNTISRAHADEPLREGPVHISAPHIYGCIVEGLHLTPNAATSFLNIGSGTGYLSSIVAHILGPAGVCYGIEINRSAYEHGLSSVETWKNENKTLELPHMDFIHGNGLNVDGKSGEALIGFDRIYVGATVERSKLSQIASLLRVGGILVAPVDDELLQVTRICVSIDTSKDIPRSLRGVPPKLSGDFEEHVITGVRFSSLLTSPKMPTVVRSRVWGPSLHKYYPESFRATCKEILLCSRAPMIQPAKTVEAVRVQSQINVASQLPKSIWIEILSYTHRDWFAQPESEEQILRRRLEQEQLAVQRADDARRDAEMRLRTMQRDRDAYRRLAFRWQARLQAVMNERGSTFDEAEDMLTDDETSQAANFVLNDPVFLRLSGMSAIIRQFQNNLSDDDEELEEESRGDDEETHETEHGAELLEDASTASDDDVSVVMEPSSEHIMSDAASPPSTRTSAMTVSRSTRTVSMSSDDMKVAPMIELP